MRTVSTLCATGLGISLSAVGLTIARQDDPSQRRTPDMTTVATYTVPTAANPPLSQPNSLDYLHRRSSFSAAHNNSQTQHLADPDWRHGRRAHTSHATSAPAQLTRDVMPRASVGLGMDLTSQRDDESSLPSGGRPSSWLRRFSGGMSSSRDSSRTPSSRPSSSAFAPSNASGSITNNGTTTPMLPFPISTDMSPNKLVKRTSSVRGTASSPIRSPPGSRLPLPILKRPATSHQRRATMQERRLSLAAANSDASSPHRQDISTPDCQWRHYFTARVAGKASDRKRRHTGIPNPIRRVYPDRKYTPILVSGGEDVRNVRTEMDDGLSADDEDDEIVTAFQGKPGFSVASSPVPVQVAHFGENVAPRRSFSIGDLLSTGPQSTWKQASLRSSRTSLNKLHRKSRRVVSAPMGNSASSTEIESGRPTKRRDVSSASTHQRSIYAPSSNRTLDGKPLNEIQLNLGTTTPSSRIPSFGSLISEKSSLQTTSSHFDHRRTPSLNQEWRASHHARHSAAQSDIPSTVDSDSEYRSVGEYSTDYQSDTVYDSFPTRTTGSSSGKRGPPIDTIFDESQVPFSSERSTRLRDLLSSDGTFTGSDHTIGNRHSTIEEEGSVVSTPVRSIRDKSVTSTPSARPRKALVFSSSPPVMNILPDPDEIDWDAPEEYHDQNSPNATAKISRTIRFPDMNLPVLNPFSRSWNSASNTPNRNGKGSASLFDWSEQQPSPSHGNQSPPRPRTVHGKKDSDNRGSRPAGRRAPSGMHARSHSVPVVPDVDGKRTNVVANKFGTWGVGSKGVTEDWNEDFDFEDDLPIEPLESMQLDERRIDSGHEMFVPKSIREQQENIVANIGLLREWGLLIEELKDLRIRAVALDMLHGPYAQAWAEVDAMIELADQESEENTLEPRKSPPSSPGFDFAAFEESLPPVPALEQSKTGGFALSDSTFTTRESVRTGAKEQVTPPRHVIATRPRKDSEAVARSVIEALQSKRNTSDPTAVRPVSASRKVPFDTATLRHIVPYVNGLKRKVKDALRQTEGLYTSPRRPKSRHDYDEDDEDDEDEEAEPAFRSIFNEPSLESSPTTRRLRRERAAADHDGYEDTFQEQRSDLVNRTETMSVPK
ncbi:Hypothetical protein R9X50_00250900 [Acrodontium crateriforme]|uniref:Uncharacterized protein n=1 Tax=Acrodontium crateriforme TaxID=150365 RepID=A0AAQ3R3I9_9PEZI|nr:Hypothetical protein R9X50_00250900 [Acrodontium crateriforme]